MDLNKYLFKHIYCWFQFISNHFQLILFRWNFPFCFFMNEFYAISLMNVRCSVIIYRFHLNFKCTFIHKTKVRWIGMKLPSHGNEISFCQLTPYSQRNQHRNSLFCHFTVASHSSVRPQLNEQERSVLSFVASWNQ